MAKIVGAIVDFLLAIFKVIAGVVGNSGALIADGIHSFSDLLSDGIVLYAAKHSAELFGYKQ
jgi:divalent metal cation (Fe/Co/Zn/Cd) transporter